MQKKEANSKKTNNKPSKPNYAELCEEESIKLISDIIANSIIEKLLFNEQQQSTNEPPAPANSKKRKAA